MWYRSGRGALKDATRFWCLVTRVCVYVFKKEPVWASHYPGPRHSELIGLRGQGEDEVGEEGGGGREGEGERRGVVGMKISGRREEGGAERKRND
ncbi:hypothetical protein E2C01_076123 [Portunus trituberculatus]|uniref:Uncharacterized protein n=1 Tax=Portunus trituberculatus TaxID=210409 RepID=A0A5B7ICE2_PORTR|nr:hypothetical protein [Portunus trituberculatus]